MWLDSSYVTVPTCEIIGLNSASCSRLWILGLAYIYPGSKWPANFWSGYSLLLCFIWAMSWFVCFLGYELIFLFFFFGYAVNLFVHLISWWRQSIINSSFLSASSCNLNFNKIMVNWYHVNVYVFIKYILLQSFYPAILCTILLPTFNSFYA